MRHQTQTVFWLQRRLASDARSDSMLKLVSYLKSPSTVPSIPNKIALPSSIEERENYRNPFVWFRLNDTLNVALDSKKHRSSYYDLVTVKDKVSRSPKFTNLGVLQMVASKTGRIAGKALDTVPSTALHQQTQLPSEIRDKVVEMSSRVDVPEILEFLTSTLDRYTHATLVCGLLTLSEQISPEFEQKVVSVCCQSLEFYDNAELTNIFNALMNLNKHSYIQQVIDQLNQSNPTQSFTSECPLQLQSQLLEFAIFHNDFRLAAQLLVSLLERDLVPSSAVVESYISLINNTANAIQADFESRKLVFMAFMKPLGSAFKFQHEPISAVSVESIFSWFNEQELFWGLEYFHRVRAKAEEINNIAVTHFSRLNADGSSMQNAVSLTSLIGHLKHYNFAPFDDSFKKAVLTLYCQYQSPVAAQMWLQQLETPLTSEEKRFLVDEISKTRPDSSIADKQHIDLFIDSINGS
ncbi:hypothetical protein OGAPHI_005648 [Ogataea philodendri]|uniref:ATPase expression protein 1 n=1 Tax=Ogataea philodendri TaxID=1378263 RepID=A0A9P8P007_9ASCO|nr:uncharacterized protein OGAPHI_005648 [Ogataea philodendri]KAH3662396.1 hypothetical protein OGAPHI_005648 [Ogataea philodendri]